MKNGRHPHLGLTRLCNHVLLLRSRLCCSAVVVVSFLLCETEFALSEPVPELQWNKVLGDDNVDDRVWGLAIDSNGNSVIVGETQGALFTSSPRFYDGFYASYDVAGDYRWGFQLGNTLSFLEFSDVTALPGGKWGVIGSASYSLGAQYGVNTTHFGQQDLVMLGLKSTGFIDWMTQVGTTSNDRGEAIGGRGFDLVYAADTLGSLRGSSHGSSDVATGTFHPTDASPPGIYVRGHQHGTSSWDSVQDLAVTPNVSFAVGYTQGSFVGPNTNSNDAFLTKYDLDGDPIWTRQYGDGQLQGASSVATDGVNAVYVAGDTYINGTSHSAGDGGDGFLAKYDFDGNLLWERFLTSDTPSSPDYANDDAWTALAVDGVGNVYAGGYRDREIFTPTSSPALIHKYSPEGDLLWEKELQFDDNHRVTGIAVDDSGTQIWVAGNATGPGTFGEDSTSDIFLAYLEVPSTAGDFDEDGDADGSDFLSWQRGLLPDASGLGDWQQSYGSGAGHSASSAAPVPEPSTIAIQLSGFAWLAVAFSSRRSFP